MAHTTASSTRPFARNRSARGAHGHVEDAISAPRLVSRATEFLRDMAHRHAYVSYDRVLISPQHRIQCTSGPSAGDVDVEQLWHRTVRTRNTSSDGPAACGSALRSRSNSTAYPVGAHVFVQHGRVRGTSWDQAFPSHSVPSTETFLLGTGHTRGHGVVRTGAFMSRFEDEEYCIVGARRPQPNTGRQENVHNTDHKLDTVPVFYNATGFNSKAQTGAS
ncbi:hypothetical protein C8Q73DRAFT_106931 [Cubamyces lactineus]|nr:hypothetical protein C8Q73DRAFT_106931 [Cubamyces lactineus]